MAHAIILRFLAGFEELTLHSSSMGDKDSDLSSAREASPDVVCAVFNSKMLKIALFLGFFAMRLNSSRGVVLKRFNSSRAVVLKH